VGAGAVAVLVAKERRIVDAFRRAGAVDPRAAVTPSTIGVAERFAFWMRSWLGFTPQLRLATSLAPVRSLP